MIRVALRTAVAVTAAATLMACERRDHTRTPGNLSRIAYVRQSELQPGQVIPAVAMRNPFEGNPHAVGEGRRLYNWYNCGGCHFAGGGGIGPPLMDDEWIYGSEPQNILDSMMEGRPNGMPSYRGKLPQEHALKIAAYVRSLGDTAPETPTAADRQREGTERIESESGDPRPEESSEEGANGARSP